MSTTRTTLVIQGAPLPPAFTGTPQEFFDAILARMTIWTPLDQTTFVTGSVEPKYNQGPWLKNGTSWWVWSESASKYVPLDISDSVTIPYWVQTETPASGDPPIWFRLSADGTYLDGMFIWLDSQWKSMAGTSGPTSARPSSPVPLERFYDTDIGVELWWERGSWKTVSGVRGDVKHVYFDTVEEALRYNPGWEILGTGDSDNTAIRGRVLGQATADSDGENALTVGTGVSERRAKTYVGAETHQLKIEELPKHKHEIGRWYRDADNATSAAGKTIGNDHPDPKTYTDEVGGDVAHNNMQPTLFLYCLRKL